MASLPQVSIRPEMRRIEWCVRSGLSDWKTFIAIDENEEAFLDSGLDASSLTCTIKRS